MQKTQAEAPCLMRLRQTDQQIADPLVLGLQFGTVTIAGLDDADKVAAAMREIPIEDVFSQDAKIRDDGRVTRTMHVANAIISPWGKQPPPQTVKSNFLFISKFQSNMCYFLHPFGCANKINGLDEN